MIRSYACCAKPARPQKTSIALFWFVLALLGILILPCSSASAKPVTAKQALTAVNGWLTIDP
ncbi:MAG: hypothetical protein DRI48_06120 [Chloroflexi bacterium]|nr:MAG: hypothetical protein DRI48_06120 [Chloroflexota bacterium]